MTKTSLFAVLFGFAITTSGAFGAEVCEYWTGAVQSDNSRIDSVFCTNPDTLRALAGAAPGAATLDLTSLSKSVRFGSSYRLPIMAALLGSYKLVEPSVGLRPVLYIKQDSLAPSPLPPASPLPPVSVQ